MLTWSSRSYFYIPIIYVTPFGETTSQKCKLNFMKAKCQASS